MKDTHLVLIHGYPFNHKMWYGVIAALGTGSKVIAPDLPGFGVTPVSQKPPSIDAMAEYILALLDEQKIQEAVIAGMSMGGYVALSLAAMRPERVAGLALISTQAAPDTDETRKARRALIQKVKNEGVQLALKAIVPKLFSPMNASNFDYIQFAKEGAEQAGTTGISWALEAMAQRRDRKDVLTRLKAPVLVIHGADDEIIPVEKARSMAMLNPDTHFTIVKQAGHATPIEAPDAVAAGLIKLVMRSVQRRQERAEAAATAGADATQGA